MDETRELRYPYRFYPVLLHITPEVEEVLKSNEAKLYLKEIERSSRKLTAFLERECKGNAAEFLPRVMREPHTATRIRHEVLHRCFDELLACYIEQIGPKERTTSILETSLHEFMQWSHAMTITATCEVTEDENGVQTDDRSPGQQADEDSEASGRPESTS